MRKQIWMPCVIVLIICFLLIIKTKHHQNVNLPVQSAAASNQSNQVVQPKAAQSSIAKNQQNPPAQHLEELTNIVYVETTPGKSNAINAHLLSQWQAPIEFYGMVVDEKSNVVADANIHFSWQEIPAEDASRIFDTKSDSEGLFSLKDARGWTLGVSVSKQGYYISRKDNDSFRYGSLGGGKFSPDPQNPVIFHLRKKGAGETLIGGSFPSGMKIAQLHHDGTPVELNLLNGTQVPAGSGQLKLELWRDISDMKKQPFDWKLQLSMPSGGLVPTDEEFAFQAPESGYQPSIVIDMPATNQDWLGEVRSKYYVQLPDGKYGRIDFYLLPRNGVFTVSSSINPTGSRNLEPAN